jgi:serine/threonine protein kinase
MDFEDGASRDRCNSICLYTRDKMEAKEEYLFEDFKTLKVLGKGTFGKVLLVQNVKNERYYGMKCIRKDVVLEHDSLESL